MDCPSCKYPEMKAIDTRQELQNTIRRRRKCMQCGKRITTREIIKENPKGKDKNVLIAQNIKG